MQSYAEIFFTNFPVLKASHLLTYLRLLDLTNYGKNIVMTSSKKSFKTSDKA